MKPLLPGEDHRDDGGRDQPRAEIGPRVWVPKAEAIAIFKALNLPPDPTLLEEIREALDQTIDELRDF